MRARAARDGSRSERVRPTLRVGLRCIWRKCGLFDGKCVEGVGFLSLEDSVILIRELLLN